MGNILLRYLASLIFILILADFLTAGGIRMAAKQFSKSVRGERQVQQQSYSPGTTRRISISLKGTPAVALVSILGVGLLSGLAGWILCLISAGELTGEEARWFFVVLVFPPAALAYAITFWPDTKKAFALLFLSTACFLLAAAYIILNAQTAA